MYPLVQGVSDRVFKNILETYDLFSIGIGKYN